MARKSSQYLCRFDSALSDGVDANDSNSVARDDLVSEVAVAVELDVSREFPFWHSIW